jgi:aminoglycoside phosphotransferase (APT) family kinase protein
MTPGADDRTPPAATGDRSDWIHDAETDTSEPVVRRLLQRHCPDLADLPLDYLRSTGTSNALWRIRSENGTGDRVVRLPRTDGADQSVAQEIALLPALTSTQLADVVELPRLVHAGLPDDLFPHHWTVMEWIEGEDVWFSAGSDANMTELAVDVAAAIGYIVELEGLPVPDREPGTRGGPFSPVLARVERWLTDPVWRAAELLDVTAVRRIVDQLAEHASVPVPRCFVHGDLIPGNLLLQDGQLSAIIDWGGAGYGDPAQDLAPAWALFDPPERSVFRAALNVDEATWQRAKGFELEHAVGGVLYYRPRRHPLGDVMAKTLQRILSEPMPADV